MFREVSDIHRAILEAYFFVGDLIFQWLSQLSRLGRQASPALLSIHSSYLLCFHLFKYKSPRFILSRCFLNTAKITGYNIAKPGE